MTRCSWVTLSRPRALTGRPPLVYPASQSVLFGCGTVEACASRALNRKFQQVQTRECQTSLPLGTTKEQHKREAYTLTSGARPLRGCFSMFFVGFPFLVLCFLGPRSTFGIPTLTDVSRSLFRKRSGRKGFKVEIAVSQAWKPFVKNLMRPYGGPLQMALVWWSAGRTEWFLLV